jgi:hypothetical protein
MKMLNQITKLGVIIPIIWIAAAQTSVASCKISQSVYRDLDGKGFELVFGPRLPGLPGVSQATAIIQHTRQTEVHAFSLTQANGYGSISLSALKSTTNGLEYGQRFTINFFDQNLRSASPGVFGREIHAPKYAFISDLGSYDYYTRREMVAKGAPPFLKDTAWVYARCR